MYLIYTKYYSTCLRYDLDSKRNMGVPKKMNVYTTLTWIQTTSIFSGRFSFDFFSDLINFMSKKSYIRTCIYKILNKLNS